MLGNGQHHRVPLTPDELLFKRWAYGPRYAYLSPPAAPAGSELQNLPAYQNPLEFFISMDTGLELYIPEEEAEHVGENLLQQVNAQKKPQPRGGRRGSRLCYWRFSVGGGCSLGGGGNESVPAL